VSAALGGSERVLLDFASRAPELGIRPIVLLPRDGPLAGALKEAGVRYAIAPARADFLELSQRVMMTAEGAARFAHGAWLWSRAVSRELARQADLAGGPVPVLYSNGFKAHLTCALLRGYRKVWHLHEFPPDRAGGLWRFLAGNLPHASIANSASVTEAWTRGRLPAPRTVLNGVDLRRFAPGPRVGWIQREFGLDPSARLIGMPAVFARWKGHLLVVEAFERAAKDLEDAHLVLVGGAIYDTVAERGYAEELVRRVKRSSLPGSTPRPLGSRIHFLKFQPDPWRLYPEFDVVVHFSTRPEPFGRVVAEAMACGVPVIAADSGGPREIVEDGRTGWLCPPSDVEALSRLLVHASREADRAAMGRAARQAAEARLSAERFAAEVAAVIHETV
jgi:glycosyltransferase involved in cell wall biosynthesis